MAKTTAKPINVTPNLTRRFMDKYVPATDECSIWPGQRDPNGYGHLHADGSHYLAHRVAYTLLVGAIPDGLVIDHLCRSTGCVNPTHLEPVTNRENLVRGMSPMAQALRSGLCYRGHERVDVDRFGDCRKCKNIRQAERRRVLEAADPSLREARLRKNRHYYLLHRERATATT